METMEVFKKVRILKDGNAYPLFIDKRKPFQFGEWMKAEFHPTKGFAPRSLGKDDDGNEIGGYHCCFQPVAPHIADHLASGEDCVCCEYYVDRQKWKSPEELFGHPIYEDWYGYTEEEEEID